LNEAIKADERFFETLSSHDAYRAALYATHEDNSLAEWLPLLAIRHSDEIVRALTQSLRVEWGTEATRGKYPKVLHRLAYRQDSITRLMTPVVRELLLAREPEDHPTLESALKVLICGDGFSTTEWAVLAKSRITEYNPGYEHFDDWLGIWLDSDAPAALNFVEATLSSVSGDGVKVASVFASLARSRSGERAHRYQAMPDIGVVVRLIHLTFHWIRPKDDIPHPKGVSSTEDPRLEAQDFRWSLVNDLAKRSEPEAEAALEMLLTDPFFQYDSPAIRYLLDKRIESNADGLPFEPADVLAFGAELEFAPRTMTELFALVCKRLQVIKEEVEIPDSASLRAMVQPGNNEAHLRTCLASELNRRARQLYRAEQEAEIDQAQRPDLRVIHPTINGAVPIEVKLADKGWTLAKLLERLETQLVGQYLRAPGCTHGIFVVGIADTGHSMTSGTGERLTFDHVIDRLQERARELEQQWANQGVEAIKVVGIDFRTPSVPRHQKSVAYSS